MERKMVRKGYINEMKDYYRILEINYQSSQEDIALAYQLACSRNSLNQELLDEAYSVLSDPEKRQDYDQNIYVFSKDSTASIDLRYSILDSMDEGLKASVLSQQDEGDNESSKDPSEDRSNTIYKYMTMCFALLSTCLFFVLLFGKNNQGLSIEKNSLALNEGVVTESNPNGSNDTIVTASNSNGLNDGIVVDSYVSRNDITNADDTTVAINTTEYTIVVRNNIKDSIIAEKNRKAAAKKANAKNEGISIYPIVDNASVVNMAHKPKILFTTQNHVASEEDLNKITSLVKSPRYQLKDPYPELSHEEKTKKLLDNPKGFFDNTFLNIKSEGSNSTIKSVFQQNDADITYYVKNNKAFMFSYIPALYVVEGNESIQDKIYHFVMYDLEIIDGKVYTMYSPKHPFTMYVTKKFYSSESLQSKQYYWFKYITIDQAREVYDLMLSKLSLDNIVRIEEDFSEGYVDFDIVHLDTNDINSYKTNINNPTYKYKLYDPFQNVTEMERLNVLKDDPESIFDAILVGIENQKGTTLKDVLALKDAEWEYVVDGKKAYMYITIPTVAYKSDGHKMNQIAFDLFVMYEIVVLPEGIYAKYEITNPFIVYIEDKKFYKDLTPEEFRWEYAFTHITDTSFIAKDDYYNMINVNWAFMQEIRRLTLQAGFY